MKNITLEQAKRISLFFAIFVGICGLFILIPFALYFTIINQFYFTLFFSILGTFGGLILIVTILFWIYFLKLRKENGINQKGWE